MPAKPPYVDGPKIHPTDNQRRILALAAEPSGPLIAEGEIVLNDRADRRDAAQLVDYGYMTGPIGRPDVGSCWAITRRGRKVLSDA